MHIVFYDALFPKAGLAAQTLSALPLDSPAVADAFTLPLLLKNASTLWMLHGEYFPVNSWPKILEFLESGGNLVNLNGPPFCIPVNISEDSNVIGYWTAQYTESLMLGSFDSISRQVLDLADKFALLPPLKRESLAMDAHGVYWSNNGVQLTQSASFPNEIGSGGPRETYLTPLVHLTGSDGSAVAAPFLMLDQVAGRFHKGRWIASPYQPSEEFVPELSRIYMLIKELVEIGMVAVDLQLEYPWVDNNCTAISGELQWQSKIPITISFTIANVDDNSVNSETEVLDLSPAVDGWGLRNVSLSTPKLNPGLHSVQYKCKINNLELEFERGFWLWDPELIPEGFSKLETGNPYLHAGSKGPVFLFGTTHFCSREQRSYLFKPDPALLRRDLDFLKQSAGSGFNAVRTGLWCGWEQFMAKSLQWNEKALRALEVWVLEALRHKLWVFVTFFSFQPPTWAEGGGINPFLDHLAIERQKHFVEVISERLKKFPNVAYDLINEPSYGHPDSLWAQQPYPNNDINELLFYKAYIKDKYKNDIFTLQQRWRTNITSFDSIKVPERGNLNRGSSSVNSDWVPAQNKDWVEFTQFALRRWIPAIKESIKGDFVIGIGQDEAGTRPNAHFHGDLLDYTTSHPWWYNQHLVFSTIMAKSIKTAAIAQEVGLMRILGISGQKLYDDKADALRLQRKFFISMAVHAGCIQWQAYVNCLMLSANERSIGMIRADGTCRDQWRIWKECSQVPITHSIQSTDIWVIAPYSLWTVFPELAQKAVETSVMTLWRYFGIIPLIVGENQLVKITEETPRIVFVPGAQNFGVEAKKVLYKMAERGACIVWNGVQNLDAYGHYTAAIMSEIDDTLSAVKLVSAVEPMENLCVEFSYPCRVFKAHNTIKSITYGSGSVLWCGLPLEVSNSVDFCKSIYGIALKMTPKYWEGVYLAHKDNTALIVNESSEEKNVQISGTNVVVRANGAGMIIDKNLYGDLYFQHQ